MLFWGGNNRGNVTRYLCTEMKAGLEVICAAVKCLLQIIIWKPEIQRLPAGCLLKWFTQQKKTGDIALDSQTVSLITM